MRRMVYSRNTIDEFHPTTSTSRLDDRINWHERPAGCARNGAASIHRYQYIQLFLVSFLHVMLLPQLTVATQGVRHSVVRRVHCRHTMGSLQDRLHICRDNVDRSYPPRHLLHPWHHQSLKGCIGMLHRCDNHQGSWVRSLHLTA